MPLRWVLFDLNGTLVDPSVLAGPLGGSGSDEQLVQAAFADAITQAMVVTLTGARAEFADLIEAGLRRRLAMAGRDDAVASDAMALLRSMPAFIEAPAALEALRRVGLQLGVLTQSSPDAADAVLRFAGLRDRLELVVSAADAGAFKPDPRPYRLAVERTGAQPDEVALVAAHWWDVAGAKRAGLVTGWVSRRDLVLPASVPEPDVTGRDLAEVAEGLAGLKWIRP
jgi:2-haloacid dehalogenase